MPIAVVVSGLGNKRPGNIISDLEEMGYTIIYQKWNQTHEIAEGDIYVGHSAGSARLIAEKTKTGKTIIALSSPVSSKSKNVHEFQNVLDPVGLLQMLNPLAERQGDFIAFGNVHSKNDAWKRGRGIAVNYMAEYTALQNQDPNAGRWQ